VHVASTIIVAREDFSIPGANQNATERTDHTKDESQRFFDLLQESRPDVVVLNLTVTEGRGVETIQKVRKQSGVPILVVCASADPLASDYRSAGAAECLHPPIDITQLNRTIQNVIRPARKSAGYRFQGITYRPDQQSLAGADGALVPLTTAENEVLGYLVAHSWTVCGRAEIAESAAGGQSPARQRGVGVVVSQLRKKLEAAGGPGAGQLLKTEPRLGYTLVADVVSLSD
jgi:DNA-binding response OmpR family regulator